jgi:hypothetical protein
MYNKTTGPTLLSDNHISHILPIPSIQVITVLQTLHPIARIQIGMGSYRHVYARLYSTCRHCRQHELCEIKQAASPQRTILHHS